MEFAEFMCVEAIQPHLQVTSKQALVWELVESLVDAGQIDADDQSLIVRAILSREEIGTTAIGNGFAIPHAKHHAIERVVATVGIVPDGLDFSSVDGKSTEIFFLLLSPVEKRPIHLRAMQKVSRCLNDESFCRRLKESASATEIAEVLKEADLPQSVLS